jgi:hypothetical protein
MNAVKTCEPMEPKLETIDYIIELARARPNFIGGAQRDASSHDSQSVDYHEIFSLFGFFCGLHTNQCNSVQDLFSGYYQLVSSNGDQFSKTQILELRAVDIFQLKHFPVDLGIESS